MIWSLGAKEKDSVEALPAAKRVQYAINRIADWEQLWSLQSECGWVLCTDQMGRECVPIWPHPEYAKACAEGDWKDTTPELISLEEWLRDWLPGIGGDGRAVAVFPSPSDEGTVLTAKELECLIRRELDRIE